MHDFGIIHQLDRPSREYTPIPFWFLNGDLRHEEIRRQLRDFQDHGVYGVVLHPRIGLSKRIGYLSPLFFRYLRTAVETAKELDMRIVLYDEGMYPSGSACGQVVAENPDLASRGLACTEHPLPGDRVLCKTERGFLAERFSGGTLRGIHFSEDDGEKNQPLSADILNPQAVDSFIRKTHERYWQEFQAYFGTTIIGFFTDEPSVLGRNVSGLQPWTKNFDAVFTRAGGQLENLAGLFSGEENADTELYRRLMLQRECKVYYARISQWCEAHGIALMGHPHQSNDIELERYFHIPGQDLVFRWVSPEKGGTSGMDSVMGQCSADMARLMGRKRNSNECFGACNRNGNPWYFTGSDMKWYIDWLTVRGVNLLIPHAFYYSLKGKRSGERPPDVGPGSIWWPYYRRWAEYMARLSCLRAETDAAAPIAVLCRNRDMPYESVAPLLESQRGFLYLPECFWAECREENHELCFREFRFQAVLGPAEMFPSVSHDPFSVTPVCRCQPAAPELRVAKLSREGQEIWHCVNEGNHLLQTEISFPCAAPLGLYDPWEGKAWKAFCRETPEGQKMPLRLENNQCLLIFTCESREAWDALPAQPAVSCRLTEEHFTLEKDYPEAFRKVYTANIGPLGEDCLVEVHAPEMAELYAGNHLIGAAFWPPQRFTVPACLLQGPAGGALRLVLTGSKANQYGNAPVPYGLALKPAEDK